MASTITRSPRSEKALPLLCRLRMIIAAHHPRRRHQGAVCLFLLTLLGAFVLGSSKVLHAAAPEFPVPTWLDKVTVSGQMNINGLPSSVQYFEAYRGLDDLLDFYRQQWSGGRKNKPGYREATIPPWHIISNLDGQYLYTVQSQQDGQFGIKGYLAIADLKDAEKNKDPGKHAPKMKGSRVINHSTSIDPGQQGETLIIVNEFSITSNSEFYRNYYQQRGWAKLVDMEQKQARALTFKKSGQEAHLVIQHLGGDTQIVMNVVQHK